ncbi:hypothetical protein TARUN_5444 [Trichoderma arundinaceum]|uniref:Uncharacterized protein n=1 Tax=Trichoderma arundinaceum TaxID=490622 RepID=A0A395NLQ9_TRIAR|nr:hypothetical protein TARUN_5444 [Trichoderma arundinaceum]
MYLLSLPSSPTCTFFCSVRSAAAIIHEQGAGNIAIIITSVIIIIIIIRTRRAHTAAKYKSSRQYRAPHRVAEALLRRAQTLSQLLLSSLSEPPIPAWYLAVLVPPPCRPPTHSQLFALESSGLSTVFFPGVLALGSKLLVSLSHRSPISHTLRLRSQSRTPSFCALILTKKKSPPGVWDPHQTLGLSSRGFCNTRAPETLPPSPNLSLSLPQAAAEETGIETAVVQTKLCLLVPRFHLGRSLTPSSFLCVPFSSPP